MVRYRRDANWASRPNRLTRASAPSALRTRPRSFVMIGAECNSALPLCSACGCFECECYTEDSPPVADANEPDEEWIAQLTDEQNKQVDELFARFTELMDEIEKDDDGDDRIPAEVWREFARRIERYAIVMADTD